MEVFLKTLIKTPRRKYMYIQYITTLRKTLIQLWYGAVTKNPCRFFLAKYLGGHPLRSVTLCSELLQNLSGTPLVIDDFAIWFSKTLRTSLAICDFAIWVFTKLMGTPLAICAFQHPSRGTPLAICDFRIYLRQKPLGEHPLRSVILGFAFLQNLRGTPLAIYDLWISFMQKPLGGHPLRSVIFGSILRNNR